MCMLHHLTQQFLCGQEYVRLIGPWCQVNIGSCRFMLAQCYLANGEGHKVSHGRLSEGLVEAGPCDL